MPSFTQAAIKKSFLKLLGEKPYNKITVKDIVEDCGINRNSFYYHFADMPTLLEEILTDEAAKIVCVDNSNDSIYECLLSALDFALQNKVAVLHIYNSVNREMFEQYLGRITQKAVFEFIERMSHGYTISLEDKEIIVRYYKCQMVGFVLDWLSGGMKYDLVKQMKRFCELFDGSMENAFIKAENTG